MILLTFVAAAALQAAPQSDAQPSETTPATVEGMEILRRLVVDGLDRLFEPKEQQRVDEPMTLRRNGLDTGNFVTTLWANESTVQHSRAFHVPEVGLFLTLDAALPVIEREPDPREDEEPDGATDDEWERARRELRGDLNVAGGFYHLRVNEPGKAFEIDPQAIDKLVDGVLQTVARHGTRVEGLGQHDTITVCVRLTGRSRAWLHDVAGEEEPKDLPKQKDGDEEQTYTRSFSAYVLAAPQDVKAQNLTLRIAVADLAGQPTLERLRQRARVNRY